MYVWHFLWINSGGAGLATAPTTTPSFFPSKLILTFSTDIRAYKNVLGVDASKATSLTNLQQAALTLVNSFDQAGLLKNGFAYTAQIQNFGTFERDGLLQEPIAANFSPNKPRRRCSQRHGDRSFWSTCL